MSTVAKWHGVYFKVSSSKVNPITEFSTSYAIKTDENKDTSGKKKSNTRGRAAEEPSFSVKYLAAAGAKPRNEFTKWRSRVGKKDYLYIGKTKYGTHKYKLMSVDISDVLLDNKGRTIQAVVTLHFKEIISKKKKTKNKKGDKKSAKNAKANKSDKKNKNPYKNKKK